MVEEKVLLVELYVGSPRWNYLPTELARVKLQAHIDGLLPFIQIGTQHNIHFIFL